MVRISGPFKCCAATSKKENRSVWNAKTGRRVKEGKDHLNILMFEGPWACGGTTLWRPQRCVPGYGDSQMGVGLEVSTVLLVLEVELGSGQNDGIASVYGWLRPTQAHGTAEMQYKTFAQEHELSGLSRTPHIAPVHALPVDPFRWNLAFSK